MSQVNASGFIRLYDATVTGQNVSLNNSSNNQNEVNKLYLLEIRIKEKAYSLRLQKRILKMI